MKVFISWSGKRSRDVAAALREWLPQVLNAAVPFVSTRDVSAGDRWATEIAERLEEADFGIVCVTRENQLEPWLNYEAGAIAKLAAASRVVPLAINLSPAEIVPPLGHFQGTEATKEGISDIVRSMNEACLSPRPEKDLNKALEKWWPDLEEELKRIDQRAYSIETETTSSPRKDREILEEVLHTVRGLAQHSPMAGSGYRTPAHALQEDLRELLRASGIPSWTTVFGLDTVDLKLRGQADQQLLDELALLGKIRNVSLNVEVEETDSASEYASS